MPQLVCTAAAVEQVRQRWLIAAHRYSLTGSVPHKDCVHAVDNGVDARLYDAKASVAWWVRAINWAHESPHPPLFIGHNTQFDVQVLTSAAQQAGHTGILAKVFDLYERGCFTDTMIRAKLLKLGTDGRLKIGKRALPFNLAICLKRAGLADIGASKKGPDVWRKRYNELAYTPTADWPIEAVQYVLDDVYLTLDLFKHQCRATPGLCDGEHVTDETPQMMGHLALTLGSTWGLRTDGPRLRALAEGFTARINEIAPQLVAAGILRSTGAVNEAATRALVEADYGGAAPRTDPSKTYPDGQTSIAADTLKECAHPALQLLVEYKKAKNKRDNFIAKLMGATEHPLCCYYDPLKETGRPSTSSPNTAQMPRKGGERECFVPRPGYLYVNADYDSIELRAWAYSCEVLLGHSALAERYRNDPHHDPHIGFAAYTLRITYNEAMARYKAGDAEIKAVRNSVGKAGNFGFLGGMGWKRLPAFAKNIGIAISLDDSEQIKQDWLEHMETAPAYFDHMSAKAGFNQTCTIEQVGSGRIRAGCTFTEACNTQFQGPSADGAKKAAWLVTREMYGAPGKDAPPGDRTALAGSRMTVFVYDEFLIESPKALAHRAADRLKVLMVAGMRSVIKTVPIEVEVSVSTRWSKQAKSTRGADGTYTIWTGDEQ